MIRSTHIIIIFPLVYDCPDAFSAGVNDRHVSC